MGTHPKGPSAIAFPPDLAGQPLSSWLERNQWALGEAVAEKFDGNLPFLFKVRRVETNGNSGTSLCGYLTVSVWWL